MTGLRSEMNDRMNSVQRVSTFAATGAPTLLLAIFPIYPSVEWNDFAPILWLLPSLLLIPALLFCTQNRASLAVIALYLKDNVEPYAGSVGQHIPLGYETWIARRRAALATEVPDLTARGGVANTLKREEDDLESWGVASLYLLIVSICCALSLTYSFKSIPPEAANTRPAAVANATKVPNIKQAPPTPAVQPRSRTSSGYDLTIAAIMFDVVLMIGLCYRFRHALDCLKQKEPEVSAPTSVTPSTR